MVNELFFEPVVLVATTNKHWATLVQKSNYYQTLLLEKIRNFIK